MPELDNVGTWLRIRRERALLTQEGLARLAGVNARTIRDLERGHITRPRVATRRLLLDALARAESMLGSSNGVHSHIPQPRELPSDVYGFTGRTEQLAALDRRAARATAHPTEPLISAISGTAGVGKTALAVHWAHRRQERFPDGQLFVNLRGYDADQPMRPADALATLLRSLGLSEADIPPDTAERAGRYRSLLADRRMLIVLDNAHSAEQIRDLLPGTPSCLVLVTCRRSLTGLAVHYGAQSLELDLLPDVDAVALLRALVGTRVDAAPDAANMLVRYCAHLPLALRVAAQIAAARPTIPLSELAAELADERHRLDVMEAADTTGRSVRTVFSWSIRRLSPDASRLFGLLGLYPGRDLDAHAVAALCATDLTEAQRLATELVEAILLDEDSHYRFRFHDLLRACATEQAAALDEPTRHEARDRLFDHYRHAAAAAMNAAFPEEAHLRPRVPVPATATVSFTTERQAVAWLDAEHHNLVAVAADAATSGWPRHAGNLSATCWRYLTNSCHHTDAFALHTAAVQAARQTGDLEAEARALSNLASVDWALGRPFDAIDNLERAAELGHQAADRAAECRALENLAGMYWQVGRYTAGADSYQRALALRGKSGKRPHEHYSHPNLAAPCERFGRAEEAAAQANRAIVLAHQYGDRVAESYGLCVIGLIRRLQGRYTEALEGAHAALAASKETGYRLSETNALNELGIIQLRLGHYAEALEYLSRALSLSRETVDRANEGYALNYLGMTYTRLGAYSDALANLQPSMAVSHAIHDKDLQAKTLNALGECSSAENLPAVAHSYHCQVISLTDDTGNRYEQARAHAGLGEAHRIDGHSERARQHWRQALELYDELGVAEAAELRASPELIL